MNFKTLAVTTLSAAAIFSAALPASASGSRCQVIYGGGEVCDKEIKFSLEKFVQKNNKGGEFVENLTANDARFQANDTVIFKLVVANTGSTKIDSITITDTLPQYLTFVSGVGTYDQNTKKVTFTLNNIQPGNKVEQLITTKIVEDKLLPQDQATVCVINQVNALESNGASASDSSQVCITRMITATPAPQVYNKVPVKNIPNTGPEMLPLLGLIPAGITGLVLRKKSTISE